MGLLLSALSKGNKHITYYALDLSKESLRDNMFQFSQEKYPNIRGYGLWGTFDDAHSWLSYFKPDILHPRYFCSLGSQFGNDYFPDAVKRWQKWSSIFGPKDRFLVGMDATSDPARLWNSYHDSDGLFERYIRRGFVHSNTLLGSEWYRHEEWDVDGGVLET